jgi:hypothetical protein
MHLIEIAVRMNQIRSKLMKGICNHRNKKNGWPNRPWNAIDILGSKTWIRIERSKLRKEQPSRAKSSFPSSIAINILSHSENAQPPRISIVCGMTMDVREELDNGSFHNARAKRNASILTISRRRRAGAPDPDANPEATAP